MSSRSFSRVVKALVLLAALGLLASCQAPRQLGGDRLAKEWAPQRVAVLPFQVAVKGGEEGSVRSPLSGASFVPGPVTEGASLALDQSLENALPRMVDFSIVPQAQAGRVFDRLRRENFSLSLIQAVVATGQKLEVDGVVLGHVYRFSQRVGGPYSADRPASAAFDLAMVRVSDGAVIWKNSFDEAQKPFSENVFAASQYMDRGLQWFTVQEWGDIGLSQLLERFPWRKDQGKDQPKE